MSGSNERQRAYDAREKARRDAATTDAHQQLIKSTGQKRVLVRASDGELFSYSKEEYGVAKSGHGPTLHTVWGYLIAVVALLALTVMSFLILGQAIQVDPSAIFGAGFLVLLALTLLFYFTRNLVIEWRARKLRKERGLPRPIQ